MIGTTQRWRCLRHGNLRRARQNPSLTCSRVTFRHQVFSLTFEIERAMFFCLGGHCRAGGLVSAANDGSRQGRSGFCGRLYGASDRRACLYVQAHLGWSTCLLISLGAGGAAFWTLEPRCRPMPCWVPTDQLTALQATAFRRPVADLLERERAQSGPNSGSWRKRCSEHLSCTSP